MNPCDGCAFTEGSEANLEVANSLRAKLCLSGGIPFYCHHSKTGELVDFEQQVPSEELRRNVQGGRMVICRGWYREVGKLAATGYYKKDREIKKLYASLGLGALLTFINGVGKAKAKAARQLKNIVIALSKARGFYPKQKDV